MIKNLNLRFNLEKAKDLKAWNLLHEKHKNEKSSYSQLIIQALTSENDINIDAISEKIAEETATRLLKKDFGIRNDTKKEPVEEEKAEEAEIDWDFLGI